jgi:hypothetical protein
VGTVPIVRTYVDPVPTVRKFSSRTMAGSEDDNTNGSMPGKQGLQKEPMASPAASTASSDPNWERIYDFTAALPSGVGLREDDGKTTGEVPLSMYRGKVMLIVNVASS